MHLRFQALRAWVLFAVCVLGGVLNPQVTAAQTPTPSPAEALSHRPLEEALLTLQNATGIDLFYDPDLIEGKRTGVVEPDADSPEALLQALLADTGLSYYRLSSGTYALRAGLTAAAPRGLLAGYVVDEQAGVPLQEAHVLLTHALHRGRATNAHGLFSFSQLYPGRYIVRTSHVGYATAIDTVEVQAGRRTELRVALQRKTFTITPLIVEDFENVDAPRTLGASLLEQDLTRVSGPGTVDVVRSLNVLSGVRVGDALADVHIQGGKAGEHQFRLDGVPVFEPVHLRGLIGAFNPFAIDRIEVHKAGFSASEGSYLAGVIDARHALTDADGHPFDVQVDPLSVNARMNLSVGTLDGVHGQFMAAYRRSVWGVYSPSRIDSLLLDWNAPDPFLLQASLISLRENVPASLLDRYIQDLDSLPPVGIPDLSFADVHAAGQLRFPKGHTLHASYYRSGNQFDGQRLVSAFDSTAQGITNPDHYAWVNENAQIRWTSLPASSLLLSMRLWSTRYTLDHDYIALGSSRRIPFSDERLFVTLDTAPADDGNRIRETTLESTADYFHRGGKARLSLEATRSVHRFSLADAFTQRIEHDEANWRLTVSAEEQLRPGNRWTITGGSRLTYLGTHATVFAEPRLDVRYYVPETPLGPLALRGAAGLYRQFVNQLDISNLSPSTLFPAVRFWMPVDATVAPPKAYHLAADARLHPSDGWTLRLEGYYKDQPHLLQIDYRRLWQRGADAADAITSQAQFLQVSEGAAYGGALMLERTGERARTAVRYEYNVARRQYAFQDTLRMENVPWSEPHRLELAFDWTPHPQFIATARWRSGWGRIWGFRQAYYDFFGTSPARQSTYGTFDFRVPAAHPLPAFHQLDLGTAYTYPFGPGTLQIRLDLLNAINRDNVADRSLIDVSGADGVTALLTHDRYLLARSLALSVRLQW